MWFTSVTATFFLVCSTSFAGTAAFIPSGTPLARGAVGAHHTTAANRAVAISKVAAACRSNGGLRMVDQDMLMAGGVAIVGVIAGAALVAFTEQQGERSASRGTISDNTRQRMSAMFMEDDEIPGTDIDDVRTRMRAALRANQTAEELEQMTSKARARAIEEADDGW